MIDWQRMGYFNRPDTWDEDGSDGVYGDVDALEASCARGEESIIYLLRRSAQGENLAKLTGPMGSDAQEPQPLADLPPEEDV